MQLCCFDGLVRLSFVRLASLPHLVVHVLLVVVHKRSCVGPEGTEVEHWLSYVSGWGGVFHFLISKFIIIRKLPVLYTIVAVSFFMFLLTRSLMPNMLSKSAQVQGRHTF